jgi:hypothetical protein
MTDEVAKPKRVRKVAEPILYPITDEDWLEIKHYVEKWRPLLGLKDWRISLMKKRYKGKDLGWVEMFLDAKLARVWVSESWGSEPKDPGEAEQFVIHELLHVRNKGMLAFAADHGASSHEDVLSEEHSQINILEDLLFNAYGDKHGPVQTK